MNTQRIKRKNQTLRKRATKANKKPSMSLLRKKATGKITINDSVQPMRLK